jgi:hypothetical protein
MVRTQAVIYGGVEIVYDVIRHLSLSIVIYRYLSLSVARSRDDVR